METKSGDRRVRKTKTILRQGLVRLMSEKSIQEITVKELCCECDINRGTFYSHYADVYDLLQKIEEEMLCVLEEMIKEYSLLDVKGEAAPSPIMSSIFRFLAQNADMCRILLCNNGDMAFVEKVKDTVKNKFMSEWKIRVPENDNNKTSEYLYAFIVSGCIGVLQQWLISNGTQTPDEMAALVENLIVRGAANS
ncbi:MAG: TetR/AcrR family transcriptional regulator C-terminal domain-containing protein [Oscillospiraceae bacterium]